MKFSSSGLPFEYHIFWVELGLCSFLDLRSLLSLLSFLHFYQSTTYESVGGCYCSDIDTLRHCLYAEKKLPSWKNFGLFGPFFWQKLGTWVLLSSVCVTKKSS